MSLSFSLFGCTSFLLPWYWLTFFTLTLQLIDRISLCSLTFSSFQLSIYNQNLSEPWVGAATQRACKPCQQESSVRLVYGNFARNCHTPNIISSRHMHVQSPIAKTIQDPLCAVGIVRMPQFSTPWSYSSPQFPLATSQSHAKTHIVQNLLENMCSIYVNSTFLPF